jgi:hypothetical protein
VSGALERSRGGDRADAHLWPLARLAGPACYSTPAQRRAVRTSPEGLGDDPAILRVDLPVDWIVVLEQEDRAGQGKHTTGALRERRCCQ